MEKGILLLAEGFEESEAIVPLDLLRRGRIETETVSITDNPVVVSSHGVPITADKVWKDIDFTACTFVVLPGGKRGTANLKAFEPLTAALNEHVWEGKLTAAICAAPSLLGSLGLLQGKRYTCFPGFEDEAFGGEYIACPVVEDENIITGRGMSAALPFGQVLVNRLGGAEALNKVNTGIALIGKN